MKLVHLCSYLRWTDPSCLSRCNSLGHISRSLGEWKILLPARSVVLLPIHSSLAPAKKKEMLQNKVQKCFKVLQVIFSVPILLWLSLRKCGSSFCRGFGPKNRSTLGSNFLCGKTNCGAFIFKKCTKFSGFLTCVQRDQTPAQLNSLQSARVNWISAPLDGIAMGPL